MSTRTFPEKSSTKTIKTSRLLGVGLLAVVAAVIANLIARAILLAVLDLPADFPPLQPPAIIFFTTIGTALGALVYAILIRRSSRPARTFTTIAVVALVISILPNLGLMANPAAAPFPGGSALAFGALIVLHIVAALAAVLVLLGLTRSA